MHAIRPGRGAPQWSECDAIFAKSFTSQRTGNQLNNGGNIEGQRECPDYWTRGKQRSLERR